MNKTQIAVNIFDKLAKEYQDKFMDVNLYSDSFDLFCENITKENAEILELACGPGNITKYLLNKRPDFKILGTDLAPNMIALAKENNPTAVFQIMDCRNLTSLQKNYDAIMCGFCLPYLSKEDAIKLIEDASTILNPNGLIYISTMEGDYSKSGLEKGSKGDEIFMHYHEAEYLLAAMKKNNFNVIELSRKQYISNEKETTDLILIGRKETKESS